MIAVVVMPLVLLAAFIFDPWQRGEERTGTVIAIDVKGYEEDEPTEVLVRLSSDRVGSVTTGLRCEAVAVNREMKGIWRQIRLEEYLGVGDTIELREYVSRVFGRRKHRFELFEEFRVIPPNPPRGLVYAVLRVSCD